MLLAAMFISCSSGKKIQSLEEGQGVSTVLSDTKNEVSAVTLNKQVFNHELVSNGKVVARGYADLRFQTVEVVVQIWVKNGDRVRKEQKLAELDKFRLVNKLT